MIKVKNESEDYILKLYLPHPLIYMLCVSVAVCSLMDLFAVVSVQQLCSQCSPAFFSSVHFVSVISTAASVHNSKESSTPSISVLVSVFPQKKSSEL